ncbi:MAG: hypothetical protein M1538_00825 [Candidatus Marsarchaeota archaeon]|nr:hypothetical protein [Candidatus Marsarchaeota archaeon]
MEAKKKQNEEEAVKKIKNKEGKENMEELSKEKVEKKYVTNINSKKQKSFFNTIKAPLLLWLTFYIIFLIGGIIGLGQLSAMFFYGSYVMFLALLFGLWLGRIAIKNSKNFSNALINAFLTTLIIGIIGFVFVVLLNNYSSAFASSVFGAPSALSITLLFQYFSSSWVEMVLTTILATAVGFEFSKQ